MNPRPPLFRIEDLSISYGRDFSLEIDHLDIPAQCTVALLGANGSGKTSLLRWLLTQPQPGKAGTQVAWVPENQQLGFDLRVSELVLMGLYPWHQGYPQAEHHKKVEQILTQLGLEAKTQRFLASLSRGEQQLVYLARGLVSPAPILLLDEPCANLDLKKSETLMQLLSHLARVEKKSILASMHQLDLSRSFFDHVIVLDRGRVVAQGRASQQINADLVQRLYGLSGWQVGGKKV